ncbi:MAG: hypothetical protein LBQ48_06715 [Oscillospiraceae bacterium]|jgi:DNA-directed RNA polymerase specialized sigma subunit|nr:hypothetical protein [Oscillospiraceae bacterium]
MKTTYLVWKDPNCGGINPEWDFLTRRQFLTLFKSPEGKKRRFVKLHAVDDDGGDDRIVIEATKKEHTAWLKEKRHLQHLRDSDPGYTMVSYHQMETEEECYGEELLPDPDCDVEAECFRNFEREAVKAALSRLSKAERHLIEYLYLSKDPGTVRGYEQLTGVSKSAASRRQISAIAKLKNFLSESAGQNGF